MCADQPAATISSFSALVERCGDKAHPRPRRQFAGSHQLGPENPTAAVALGVPRYGPGTDDDLADVGQIIA